MRIDFLSKLACFVSAAAITFSCVSMTVFAQDPIVSDTTVSFTDGQEHGTGDITVTYTEAAPALPSAVVAEGYDVTGMEESQTDVIINGDVTVSGNVESGVVADAGSTVVVTGDVNFNSTFSGGSVDDSFAVVGTGESEDFMDDSNLANGIVAVHGNVYSTTNGVNSNAYNSMVNVAGDVVAPNGYGVWASSGRVYVRGDVRSEKGIIVQDGSLYNIVSGDVIGGGVVSQDSSFISVKGITTNNNDPYAAAVSDNSFIKVNENVNAENNGVVIAGSGSMEIRGNVTAGGDAITIYGNDIAGYSRGKQQVIVKGIVSSANGYAINLVNVDGQPAPAPEIVVHQFDVPLDRMVAVDGAAATEQKTQEVLDAIRYLIKFEDRYAVDSVTGDTYVDPGIYAMTRNDVVTVTLAEGYDDLEGSESVCITRNPDGTFTITLRSIYGGINLRAIVKAVEEETGEEVKEIIVEDPTAFEDTNEDNKDKTPGIPADNYGAAPGMIKVVNTVEDAGTVGKTLTLDINEITPLQMKKAICDNVDTTPQGGTLRIVANKAACLDRAMLEKFAQRPDLEYEFIFTELGIKYRVVIPRGFDVMKLLDERGYCGFLRLLAILKGEVVE